MEFTATLQANLHNVYHERDPTQLASLINDNVQVETPLCSARGAQPLMASLQTIFNHLPTFTHHWRDVVIRQQSLSFLGEFRIAQATGSDARHDTSTLINNMIVFLFSPDVSCQDNITHVFLCTYVDPQHTATQNSNHNNKHTIIMHLVTYLSQLITPTQHYKPLTSREIQCLSLYLHCKTFKGIGNILNISARTAETHINNVMKKLNCHAKNNLFDLMNDNYQCIPSLFELHNTLLAHHKS